MQTLIQKVEERYKKPQVVDVRPGDTVKVHQKISEGGKERVQVFQGLVIRADRKNSLSSRITVRRVASGIGVEKSFLLHSPLVLKVEVSKRSRVRRNYLSYMRKRAGKSARLTGVDFDRDAVNTAVDKVAEAEEEKVKKEAEKEHKAQDAKKEKEETETEAKVEQAKSKQQAADNEKTQPKNKT